MPDGEKAHSRRRGRPAGKRGTFSFRVTAELRTKLEASAASSGRPVSEEIEARLEQSFAGPEFMKLAAQEAIKQTRNTFFGGASSFDTALVFAKLLYGFKLANPDWREHDAAVCKLEKLISEKSNELVAHHALASVNEDDDLGLAPKLSESKKIELRIDMANSQRNILS